MHWGRPHLRNHSRHSGAAAGSNGDALKVCEANVGDWQACMGLLHIGLHHLIAIHRASVGDLRDERERERESETAHSTPFAPQQPHLDSHGNVVTGLGRGWRRQVRVLEGGVAETKAKGELHRALEVAVGDAIAASGGVRVQVHVTHGRQVSVGDVASDACAARWVDIAKDDVSNAVTALHARVPSVQDGIHVAADKQGGGEGRGESQQSEPVWPLCDAQTGVAALQVLRRDIGKSKGAAVNKNGNEGLAHGGSTQLRHKLYLVCWQVDGAAIVT